MSLDAPLPPLGSPDGAAKTYLTLNAERQQCIREAEKRNEEALENEVREKLLGYSGSLRWYSRLHLALAVLLLGGLYVVGSFLAFQTISLFTAISLWPESWRLIGYIVMGVPALGALASMGGFMLVLFRYKKAGRLRLATMQELEARGDLRTLAVKEAGKARKEIEQHLRSFDLGDRRGGDSLLTAEQKAALKIAIGRLQDPDLFLGELEWLNRFKEEFQAICDEAAERVISRHGSRVALTTAASPFRLTDMLIVLHGAFALVRDLCRIYQLRLDASGNLLILSWLLGQTYLAGNLETGNGESIHSTVDQVKEAVPDFSSEIAGTVAVAAGQYIGRQVAQAAIQKFLMTRLGNMTRAKLRWIS